MSIAKASLNVISRDTMIVNNPVTFLKFLDNGTYEVILKVQSGKGGQEFFVPRIRDTTQDKIVAVRQVFPLGCHVDEVEFDGKISAEVKDAPSDFLDAWKAIQNHFFAELIRQKSKVLKEGETPTIMGSPSRAKILAGVEEKLREAYGAFHPESQAVCFTLGMVWFREQQVLKDGTVEEVKMGVQNILGYPSGGSKPLSKKRKVSAPEGESTESKEGC